MTPPHLLVVDDNDINRQIVMHLLGKMGVTATEASSGEEAVRRVASGHFDLVLMDIQMPEMDGIETTRRIRDAGFDALPIIAFTSPVGDRDATAYLRYGMNGLLVKPLDPADLAEMVRQWVRFPVQSPAGFAPDQAKALAATGEIDLARLLVLSDGVADFAIEQLRGFIEVYSDLSDELGPAIESENRAEVRRLMVSLKLPCHDIAAAGLAREAHVIALDIKRKDVGFRRVEAFRERFDTFLATLAEAVLN